MELWFENVNLKYLKALNFVALFSRQLPAYIIIIGLFWGVFFLVVGGHFLVLFFFKFTIVQRRPSW